MIHARTREHIKRRRHDIKLAATVLGEVLRTELESRAADSTWIGKSVARSAASDFVDGVVSDLWAFIDGIDGDSQ